MTTLEKIDAILKERKMSRRQLAQKAGIPHSTLASIYSRSKDKGNTSDMSIQMLLDIAAALSVDVVQLLGDDVCKDMQTLISAFAYDEAAERRLEEQELYNALFDATENYLRSLHDVGLASKNFIDDLSVPGLIQMGKMVALFCESLIAEREATTKTNISFPTTRDDSK